jgi:chloramphenicol-sensitive protein RarD
LNKGLLLAITAYTIWGCYPLYFNYLIEVQPLEVLSHRIIWSFVTTLIFAAVLQRVGYIISALRDKRTMGWMVIASALIAINWFVYIYAVTHHRIVESSLGYFIMPVVSLTLARIIFKERLDKYQRAAALFALCAVCWELFSIGQLPWISLVLSVAFALYGVIKKMCHIDSLTSLSLETLLILPFILAWITWQANVSDTALIFSHDAKLTWLLVGSGLLTAVPLVLFGMAARITDLSVVGFVMYINPIMQFVIGVFVLDEHFPEQRLYTFILIWIALILFTIGLVKKTRTHSR